MWPSDIWDTCVFTSSQVTGLGRKAQTQSWPTKAFLRSHLWLLRDSDGRGGLGELNIELTCIQGCGDRACWGDAWEKDLAELEACGDWAGGSKGGSSCWEVETSNMVMVR